MAFSAIRFNFLDPEPSNAQRMSDRYRAGLAIARYADARGFSAVTLEEHHSSSVAWSPTPLLNAAMILTSTENLMVSVSALLVPLHDPIRVAEDIAVIDLTSKGRLVVVTGLGYRPVEYAAMGKDWKRRGRILDDALGVMLTAWKGEPFERNGEMVQVLPTPFTKPHPMLLVGGSSPATARRAARFGLPLQLPGVFPEIESLYYEECERQGTQGFCISPDNVVMTHVAEDPDRVWAQHGDCFMNEARLYKSWQPPGQSSAVCSSAANAQELREEGIYRVLTPADAVELARANEALLLHPMVGGMPIEEAWSSVQLTAEQVLPALAA